MRQSLAIKKENVDLEKQVNKLNNLLSIKNSVKLALLFVLLGHSINTNAQDRLSFEEGKTYILKKVSVSGKVTYNEQTIVTFAGLEKGQKITVPGEEISNAIKKLGKLGLFSEIDFYVNKIEGDSIYLGLAIKELPKLSDVKFTGVKKNILCKVSCHAC